MYDPLLRIDPTEDATLACFVAEVMEPAPLGGLGSNLLDGGGSTLRLGFRGLHYNISFVAGDCYEVRGPDTADPIE